MTIILEKMRYCFESIKERIYDAVIDAGLSPQNILSLCAAYIAFHFQKTLQDPQLLRAKAGEISLGVKFICKAMQFLALSGLSKSVSKF